MTAEGIKAMAVDLDGTLLHPEPEAIRVWGRSGYRYMSKTAAEFLVHISRSMPLIIATGRNAQSVHNLVKQIDDLKIAGFVMENGLVARRHLFSECGNERSEIFADAEISFQNSGAYNGFKTRFTVPECGNERSEIFADEWESVTRLLPDWERLSGYEKCAGFIFPPDADDPKRLLENALACSGKSGLIYQEDRKMFVYPEFPSKLAGIRALGFAPFIALGDECNDLEMLRAGVYSATSADAHETVKQCVREKKGYCSAFVSHAAAEDILAWTSGIICK